MPKFASQPRSSAGQRVRIRPCPKCKWSFKTHAKRERHIAECDPLPQHVRVQPDLPNDQRANEEGGGRRAVRAEAHELGRAAHSASPFHPLTHASSANVIPATPRASLSVASSSRVRPGPYAYASSPRSRPGKNARMAAKAAGRSVGEMSQTPEEPLSGLGQEEKEDKKRATVRESKDQGQGVATGTLALLSGFVSVFV